MTREQKIQWLKDVRDGKVAPKLLDYAKLSADDLNRLIMIYRRKVKEKVQPTEAETSFMIGLYKTQGLEFKMM